jgi:hypothetical protein
MALFDEVWLLHIGDRSRLTGDRPEDGWLTHNPRSGLVDYEIDETDNDQTISPDPTTTESDYAASLWSYYARRGYCLTTEVKASRPENRVIENGRVKFEVGETRKPDLVVGKPETYNPVDDNSYLHAIEVKQSLSRRKRLAEQLSVYRDSGMFSHVSVAVPETELRRAYDFLQDGYDDLGLLLIGENGAIHEQEEQQPQRLELRQVPVINFDKSEQVEFMTL